MLKFQFCLDRINRIDRILAWRTGDTEDGVFSMENRRSRRKSGVAIPDPAESPASPALPA